MNLGVGARGKIELNGVPISMVKGDASIDGKLVVGSTGFHYTKRPRTRSLREKVIDLQTENKSFAVILDQAEEFKTKSLSTLAKTLRINMSARLMMLASKDIDEKKIGYCDKLKVSYEPGLVDHIPKGSFLLRKLGREVIEYVLKVAKGSPANARNFASMIYGDHRVNKREDPVQLKMARQVLRSWRKKI